jgi:transposase
MASYIIEHKSGYNYIVESIAYWDKDLGKARSIKNYIGKIDPTTGHYIFKEKFLKTTTLQSITIKGEVILLDKYTTYTYQTDTNSQNNVTNDTIIDNTTNNNDNEQSYMDELLPSGTKYSDLGDTKYFGATYLLAEIAKKIKLFDVLQSVFPKLWAFIFNLISFIIIKNDKMDSCNDWLDDTIAFDSGSMASQRISELFDTIKKSEINLFYQKWIKIVKENEFIALDITSISTYSKNIEDAEDGYNRDKDNLPQFNICMLFGEQTYLPMYQTIYDGSLNDVTTLKNTITEFSALIGDFNFMLVMDKGFYSQENINYMISNDGLKFVISVPFTNLYSKELIKIASNDIITADNYIKKAANGDVLKGVQKYLLINNGSFKIIDSIDLCKYDKKYILNAFIYYNKNKALRDEDKFFVDLADNKIKIINNPDNFLNNKYKKYFDIVFSDDKKTISSITTNNQKVNEHLSHNGFMILLSNCDFDKEYCLNIYSKRDVVEKSFHNYKSFLGLDRPYVHGSKRMINKTFIIFISQILFCSLHKLMVDNDMYKNYSIKKMLNQLQKIKQYSVNNVRDYLKPLTKKQKLIFEKLNINSPQTIVNNHKNKPK